MTPHAVCAEAPDDNSIFPVVVSQELDVAKLFQDSDQEEDKAMQQIVDDNQEEVPVAARTQLAAQEELPKLTAIPEPIALSHKRPSRAPDGPTGNTR